jgi:glycine cleavage system H lipoate-binding protein
VDGLAVPEWLKYAPNHMWLDMAEDGYCHVGIDALLAKVLNHVDRIGFLTTRGEQRPAAVLSVGGIDLQVLFPNPIRITATNTYLRANPAKLTSDPYRLGWLFEGVAAGDDPATATSGLLDGGEAATRWMTGEVDRLSRHVHELTCGSQEHGLMADGGSFAPDLLQHLDRARTLDLFHAFFSPSVEWTRSSQ